jgi:hypothetical protein
MSTKYTNIFCCNTLQNLPKLFFGMQMTIPSGIPDLSSALNSHLSSDKVEDVPEVPGGGLRGFGEVDSLVLADEALEPML